MQRVRGTTLCFVVFGVAVSAAQTTPSPNQPLAGLTIYNQDFAVVRKPITLDLRSGITDVSETDVAAHIEPDSVVLRDPSGQRAIQVMEQNYDGALLNQAQMMAKFEGQTINFAIGVGDATKIVPGKIVRAASVPQYDLAEQYGLNYFYQNQQMMQLQQQEPLIEIDGKLRYGLPGTPLFPSDKPGLTLRPTLHWLIASDRAQKVPAELDYVTRGLRWDASYNVVAPSDDAGAATQRLEMVGWVNVTNESGMDFNGISLQLMAGDVSKLTNVNGGVAMGRETTEMATVQTGGAQEQITQKNFDDYHLYNLHRAADLPNHQSKQIEFLNVTDIPATRVYVYDGFSLKTPNGQVPYYQWNQENFGGESSKKVWIMQEFKNSEANHLGMPLPEGRMRFYRRDADGSLQFVGENKIDHTPQDETIRAYLGNAFDLTGERVRTDFRNNNRSIVESYRISVRNAKDTATPVRVVEHMYRTATWQISANSDPYDKTDSQTIEFNVDVPPHGEKIVTYTATYTW